MVSDNKVVKKATIAKGLTSIFDIQFVKVKTVTTVKGTACDSLFGNGTTNRPSGDSGSSLESDPGVRG